MKTIQDEMFNLIEAEIKLAIDEGKFKRDIDETKTIKIARGLVDIALEKRTEESLSSDYIALVKAVCNFNKE